MSPLVSFLFLSFLIPCSFYLVHIHNGIEALEEVYKMSVKEGNIILEKGNDASEAEYSSIVVLQWSDFNYYYYRDRAYTV